MLVAVVVITNLRLLDARKENDVNLSLSVGVVKQRVNDITD